MNRRQSNSTASFPNTKLTSIGSSPSVTTTVPALSTSAPNKSAIHSRSAMKPHTHSASSAILTTQSTKIQPYHHQRPTVHAALSASTPATESADKLPKQFVAAMRTLFDIMDDKRIGFVRLTDIEQRWKDDGAKGLPHGVIDSLRKVTPPNGLLSFERFCAGLKICLLRNQQSEAMASSPEIVNSKPRSTAIGKTTTTTAKDAIAKPLRPPTIVPLLDLDTDCVPVLKPKKSSPWAKHTNTAAVRPNNMFPVVQRALSLPKLSPESDDLDRISPSGLPIILPTLYPPPKPPRTALVLGNGVTNINHLDRLDKAEIRHALQNWQMGILMNEMDGKDKRALAMQNVNRGTADGGSVDSAQAIPATVITTGGVKVAASVVNKGSSNRRREPRRHTLQNGIDYNMLKRLKQFEQEKEVLLHGLGAVDRTREWYVRQITEVQDKIKQLGKMGSYMEQWGDAYEERIDLQRARVTEVNRHLTALTGSWERGGLPMHMNLAVRQSSVVTHPQSIPPAASNASSAITGNSISCQHQPILPAKPNKVAQFPSNDQLVANNRLKQQNRQLSDEVTLKSQRIAALERERKALVQDLVASQRAAMAAQQQINHNNNLSNVSDEVIF